MGGDGEDISTSGVGVEQVADIQEVMGGDIQQVVGSDKHGEMKAI